MRKGAWNREHALYWSPERLLMRDKGVPSLKGSLRVVLTENYEESCVVVARSIAEVMEGRAACLGLATGGSMLGVYAELRRLHRAGGLSFRFAVTVNLDEYVGLPPSHAQSYRRYMDDNLFDHVDIDKARTYLPNGALPQGLMLEEFRAFLDSHPRDLQVLGLGSNGHIGFNEPAPFFTSRAHVVTLDERTRRDNRRFFPSPDAVPAQAVTMGIGDILDAAAIVMLVHGASKAEALRALLEDERVRPEVPCTALKLHRNVVVVAERALVRPAGL